MDIGERIKRRRNEIGLTLKEVADKIGVKDATVQRYESGNIKTLKQETVGKLAEVLRVTPSYLMGWDDLPDNVTPISDLPMIPVVGEIAAGIPILAEENIIGYIPTDIANPQDYFYLHVKGDSMINAEITNGSDVLILRQNCADNGDIVACRVNGDSATLKRFKQIDDTVFLLPENPDYEPIIVKCSDFDVGYAQIVGVAVEVVKRKRLK